MGLCAHEPGSSTPISSLSQHYHPSLFCCVMLELDHGFSFPSSWCSSLSTEDHLFIVFVSERIYVWVCMIDVHMCKGTHTYVCDTHPCVCADSRWGHPRLCSITAYHWVRVVIGLDIDAFTSILRHPRQSNHSFYIWKDWGFSNLPKITNRKARWYYTTIWFPTPLVAGSSAFTISHAPSWLRPWLSVWL